MEVKGMAGGSLDAIEAISRERKYQDAVWGEAASEGKHEVGAFVLFMEHHLQQARAAISTGASPGADQAALAEILKVAALGVCCMEQHGAPLRDLSPRAIREAKERHGVLAPEPPEPPLEKSDAYKEGWKAFQVGSSLERGNPYLPGTADSDSWRMGWSAAGTRGETDG